jgi:hypothetical protein
VYGEDEIIVTWFYYGEGQQLFKNTNLISFNHMFFSFKPSDGYTGSSSFTYYTKIGNGEILERNIHVEVFHDYNYLKLSNRKKVDLRPFEEAKEAKTSITGPSFFDVFSTEGTGFNWKAMNTENKYLHVETEKFIKNKDFKDKIDWITFICKNEHLRTDESYDYTLSVERNPATLLNVISIYGPEDEESSKGRLLLR